MSTNSGKSPTSPDDEFVLVLIAMLFLGSVVGAAAFWWSSTLGWARSHGLVVAPKTPLLFTLPSSGGVGLDAGRVMIVAGVLLAVVAVGVHKLRRRALKPAKS